jgi:hypothetical protein
MIPSLLALLSFQLQPGDVLLQSQPCFMCSLIEIEEGLPYSHAGVVVRETSGTLSVLEAWNRVGRVPITEFLGRRRKETRTLALRPQVVPSLAQNPATLNQWLSARFQVGFVGHSYDPKFLWNNADASGESYYCSELVTKLLNPLLVRKIATKPMHFQKHREYWIRYFGANPPDNEPGVSPADLARSPSFRALGEF